MLARYLTATLAGAVVAAGLLAPQAADAGKSDDTMTIAFQRGIMTVDHLYTTKREYIIVSEVTDDNLFHADPVTMEYVPLLAKSYKYVNDTTLDVDLRAGIKFHDGSPFSADDVVYTYEWALNKDSKFMRQKLLASWIKGVEKTGPLSVRFHLKMAYPLAIRDLARTTPIRKKGSYHPVAGGKPDPAAQGLKLNGLGPYKVVELDPGKKVVLERFEDYYKASPKGRPAIKRIVIRSIPDWGTQQAELMSGGLDWMYAVPLDIAASMGATGRAIHLPGPSMRVGFIPLDAGGYTGKDNPLTKLDVRRAMIHAINREGIVKHIVKGGAQVIHSACHPIQFGCYQDVMKYAYDPAKAKALLAGAGYPDGIELDLWAYRDKSVSEAIAADLTSAGIKVNLRYVKLASLNKARKNREIAAYFGTWGSGGTADTAAIAHRHWNETSDRNLSGDPKVTELVVGAQSTIDTAKRKELYKQALSYIAEQAYWVPLYAYSLNYLTSKELSFEPPKDGLPRLYEAKWK